MFRPEIKLGLQRSRLMTESFKQTDGEAMIIRRGKALAHVLNSMGIFIRDYERIVGYQTAGPATFTCSRDEWAKEGDRWKKWQTSIQTKNWGGYYGIRMRIRF